MQVAVLGTGVMGAGMARSLLREGIEVRVWNRSTSKAQPLADDGATVATSAGAAVTGADVVLTMLYDADSVIEVMGGVAGSLGPDTVWLQSSTVGRTGMLRVEELARELSLNVMDTPVLGTKKPAEEGALVVLASGDPSLRDRVEPVLQAIGSRTVWAGDQLGRASALKLACNAWVASLTAAVGQSIALAEAFGLDPQLFLDSIAGGATDTPYAHVKGGQMIAGEFPVSFALDGVVKDLGLIQDAAAAAGVSTELLGSLRQKFAQASADGYGGADMAAVRTAFGPTPGVGS